MNLKKKRERQLKRKEKEHNKYLIQRIKRNYINNDCTIIDEYTSEHNVEKDLNIAREFLKKNKIYYKIEKTKYNDGLSCKIIYLEEK